MSTTPQINKHSIGEHRAVKCDHFRIVSESVGANLDLQIQFSTDINDLSSRQPVYNVFLKQNTLDNLHVYSIDTSECIPEIPRQMC
jgi:hypothetical protein